MDFQYADLVVFSVFWDSVPLECMLWAVVIWVSSLPSLGGNGRVSWLLETGSGVARHLGCPCLRPCQCNVDCWAVCVCLCVVGEGWE